MARTYELYYQQTAIERRDTNLDASVRKLLQGMGIPIIEESGGTALNVPENELGSEQSFVVETTLGKLNEVCAAIQDTVGRDITITAGDDL